MPDDRITSSFLRIEEEHTVQGFLKKHPHEAANFVVRWWQLVWYGILVALITLLFLKHEINLSLFDVRFRLYFSHIIQVFCTFYIVVIALKLVCVTASIGRKKLPR